MSGTYGRLAVDHDSRPFWEGLERGELSIQCCSSCGTCRWPARAVCNHCYSFEQEWRQVSGRASVSSWIRTHHPFIPAFADQVPYITVRARLAEQDNITMNGMLLQSAGDRDPQIGMALEAVIERTGDGPPRVCWRRCEGREHHGRKPG